MTKTNAMRLLDQAKVPYELQTYPFDEADLSGLHAADFFHIHHISLTVDRNIEGTHDGISSCQNRSICCHVQADTISK